MGAQDEFLRTVPGRRSGKDRVAVPLQAVPVIDYPKVKPIIDKIVVEPMRPPTKSAGGLALADSTRDAEIALTTVGQVKAIGALCFTAKTQDGLDYSQDPNVPKVGDWIMYRKHAGQPFFIRQGEGQRLDKREAPRLLVMSEEDLLLVFESEAEARKIWAWCG